MDRLIHIIGVDPGGTTGWCRLTVPRLSIFGREPPEIVERDYGELHGSLPVQALAFARYVRATQSLSYKVGPAIVTEAWEQDPTFKSTDPEALSPARFNAMLELLAEQNLLGDATVTEQPRGVAKETYTDARLSALNLFVNGSRHIQDAHRHALTGLRRAAHNADRAFAAALWPYAAERKD